MSGRQNDNSEDIVTRAVAATRRLPLPTRPSAAIASQTLAALREAAVQPKAAISQRVTYMPWTSKAIAILATAASLLVMYVGLSSFSGKALAFADVVEVLHNVRSATWKTRTEVKGPQAQNKTVTWAGVGMFRAPFHERTEITAGSAKTIQIVDGDKDQVISLVPAAKTATVLNLKNLPSQHQSPFGKTFLGLRELVAMARDGRAEKVERLGAETIDGRPAEGYRIERGSIEVKMWADAQTLLPVRVEERTLSDGPQVRIVMTEFQIDVDLDPSLFSLDVPSGYTVQQAADVDLSKRPITYVAEALKMAAEANEGVFPPTLRGEDGIDGILQRAAKKFAEQHGQESPAEAMRRSTDLSMTLGGAYGVLLALSSDNDWHYAAKDVKLNTPDRPIFWYKSHKASTTYEVLYADLSVREVPADEAPKAPTSEGSSEP